MQSSHITSSTKSPPGVLETSAGGVTLVGARGNKTGIRYTYLSGVGNISFRGYVQLLVAIDMNFTCHISGQSTLSLIPGDGSASVGATESPPSGPVGPVVEAGPAASNAVHRLRRMGAATAGATAGTALGLFCSGLFTGVKEVGGGGFAKTSIFSDFTICGPPKLVLDLLTGIAGFDAGALAGVATGLGPQTKDNLQ